MSALLVEELIQRTKNLSIEETLAFLANEFSEKVVFSTSFGQEDQVITALIATNELPIKIFTLDTGRLFQETYDVFHKTLKKYKVTIQTFYPETSQVENLLNTKGPNSFYESVENRKECCFIRKVVPLKKGLAGNKVWITGLRAEQSENRNDLALLNTMPILISSNSILYSNGLWLRCKNILMTIMCHKTACTRKGL